MENLKIDENSRWVLGAVTNDGNNEIRNARVNPITGALIVEATVTSTNTQIGSTIPGGTAGSVLFLGLGGTLSQDNANFFYDDTNNFLGLGTNTPNAMLDVQGSAIITGSTGTPTFVLGRDGSGNLSNIVLGANLTLTGGVLSANTSGATGYDQIQDDGTNVTQRTTLNFVDYFTITDASSKTNVSINTAELGADTTLISTLETNMDLANISGQIDLSTQVTGVLSATNIDITNLESNLDLANIAGQIDLTTQVTGSLSLANGGTGQSLTDPNYNAVYVWDNTTNTTRLAQLSGISYNSGTNTLTSTGGGISLNTILPVFSVAKIASDDTYIYNDISSGSGLTLTRYKITNGGLRVYNDNGALTYWLSSSVYDRAGTGITAFTTLGGYIYIWARKISTGIYHFLQIDTITKTIVEMTISGTAPAQATSSITTDGTNIYISTYNTTTINVYSVLGTTITFVSTLPATTNVVYNIGCNFSNLFTVENNGGSTYIIREYTLSGTLINTETIGSTATIMGFFMQNGNFQYYGSNVGGNGIIINSYQ